MYGFRYNGKHTYDDFGITIAEKDVGYPEKKKIKVAVPYSNVEYDFSEIYGDQTYTERPITFVLNVLDRHVLNDTQRVNAIETSLANWLMNSGGKQGLYDDAVPGYYYLAEVESGLDFEELWNHGRLTVEFTAYPFMISEYAEGNDLWDPFNFLTDVSQVTEFNVNGSVDVTLYNMGAPSLSPKIEASAQMEIIHDGTTFNVPSGTSQSDDFRLSNGENKLKINGNGTIKFTFYKELI